MLIYNVDILRNTDRLIERKCVLKFKFYEYIAQ